MNKDIRQKAYEHIIFSKHNTYSFPIKGLNVGIFNKIIEAIDIALKERDKQWEDAIDECTPDGSLKIIKKKMTGK